MDKTFLAFGFGLSVSVCTSRFVSCSCIRTLLVVSLLHLWVDSPGLLALLHLPSLALLLGLLRGSALSVFAGLQTRVSTQTQTHRGRRGTVGACSEGVASTDVSECVGVSVDIGLLKRTERGAGVAEWYDCLSGP